MFIISSNNSPNDEILYILFFVCIFSKIDLLINHPKGWITTSYIRCKIKSGLLPNTCNSHSDKILHIIFFIAGLLILRSLWDCKSFLQAILKLLHLLCRTCKELFRDTKTVIIGPLLRKLWLSRFWQWQGCNFETFAIGPHDKICNALRSQL